MQFKSVNDVLKQAAIEVGLMPINSPVDSTEEAYIQLVGLLQSCGQELIELHPWQQLVRPFEIVTAEFDEGIYNLPRDFNYMIDQTGWDRKNQVAVGGPLSAQDWTFLQGRNLVSQTIYVSFRQWEGKLYLFPQPPPVDMRITFEYMSNGWLQNPTDPQDRYDSIKAGSDIILLHPLLITKFLKMKFLQAKGFDSNPAAIEFDTLLGGIVGKDTGAPILSAAGFGRGFPYITPYGNTGDTGYGGV